MPSPSRRAVVFALACVLGVLPSAFPSTAGFRLTNHYTVNPDPTGIVSGDFNRDGNLDLAAITCGDRDCGTTGAVQVLFGHGDGTFTLGGLYAAGPDGTTADTMTAGDFNGDGIPDVAVVNSAINVFGTVSILISDGLGGFLPPVSYDVDGAVPVWAAVGDFNGDQMVDLAVSVTTTAVVSVLLGNGDGTLQPAIGYPVESGVQGIAVGDVNRDGKLDIVSANECGNDPACRAATISVLLGKGDGTFQPEVSFPSGGIFPLSVALGDFNRDGSPDIAVALPCGTDPTCVSNGAVGIAMGNGDGSFQPVVPYPATGFDTARVVVGDFNRDRRSDLVAANVQSSNVTVFQAKRSGALASGIGYTTSQGPIWMALGDVNGDRAMDIAVADQYGSDISILLNTGGTFVDLSSNSNPSKAGEPVTFTATVAASLSDSAVPSGTVKFTTGAGSLGTAPLVNGAASFTVSNLPAGTHWIHALYSGDAKFSHNLSSVLKQRVKP